MLIAVILINKFIYCSLEKVEYVPTFSSNSEIFPGLPTFIYSKYIEKPNIGATGVFQDSFTWYDVYTISGAATGESSYFNV